MATKLSSEALYAMHNLPQHLMTSPQMFRLLTKTIYQTDTLNFIPAKPCIWKSSQVIVLKTQKLVSDLLCSLTFVFCVLLFSEGVCSYLYLPDCLFMQYRPYFTSPLALLLFEIRFNSLARLTCFQN